MKLGIRGSEKRIIILDLVDSNTWVFKQTPAKLGREMAGTFVEGNLCCFKKAFWLSSALMVKFKLFWAYPEL